ncbi:MAG: transposase [Chitinispirillaceae bacterium]
MSTKPRVVVPYRYYQIRSEAAPGLKLFPSKEQKNFFNFQLNRLLEEASYECVEKCLQQDHYHLVVKVSEVTVSWFMRTFNSIYAKYINSYYKRHGTVFPVRFSSAILDEEYGVKEVSCHVHLNPVRCKKSIPEIIKEFNQGGFDSLPFFQNEHTRHQMEFLKDNADTPRYRGIINKVRKANKYGHRYENPRDCIIGRSVFENECLWFHGVRVGRMKQNRERDPFQVIGAFHSELIRMVKCESDDLYMRGYADHKSKVRELFVLVGVFQLEFSGADLARYLGVTRSAVSRMIARRAGSSGRLSEIRRLVEEFC